MILPGYEKWIEGEYYQYPKLREAFTDKTKKIWNLLREGYPIRYHQGI